MRAGLGVAALPNGGHWLTPGQFGASLVARDDGDFARTLAGAFASEAVIVTVAGALPATLRGARGIKRGGRAVGPRLDGRAVSGDQGRC